MNFHANSQYKLKKSDKANCDTRHTKVVMIDLQKCMHTLLLKNAQSTKSVSCYVWDKSTSGRGGNEMGSSLMTYISNLEGDIEEIIIRSDNCPSQNRNVQIIMCYNTAQPSIIISWDWQHLVRPCGPKFSVDSTELTDLLYDNGSSLCQSSKKNNERKTFSDFISSSYEDRS
nr:unnamed protein product [Callosobruchus analis]